MSVITVNPSISGNATAAADIVPVAVNVTPSVSEDITVSAVLSDNVVSVSAVVSDTTIEADPEYYSAIHVYSEDIDYYSGSYVFTPTTATQTISIANKMPIQDITINPIPSNYGLITWNGSTLTIS